MQKKEKKSPVLTALKIIENHLSCIKNQNLKATSSSYATTAAKNTLSPYSLLITFSVALTTDKAEHTISL